MLSIYLVDDEPMAVRYMAMMLESCGYPCEIAGTQTNSTRALYEIRSLNPDIVFTDISMPVMDGLELAEKVLKTSASRVYLLTSYEDFEFAKKGVKIGVTDYLLKNEMNEEMHRSLLEDAEKEIVRERKSRQLILERNIRDFLLGSSTAGEDHAYEERTMQRYALLTFYKPPRLRLRRNEGMEENLSMDSFFLQHTDLPKGMKCVAFAQTRDREYCAVIFISEMVVDSARRLFQTADMLLSKMTEADPGWKCICSEICLHFFELQDQYKKLAGCTGYLYAQQSQSVCMVQDILRDISAAKEAAASSDDLLEEIRRCLAGDQHEQAIRTTEAFFDLCRSRDTQAAYMDHMRSLYQLLRRASLKDGRGLEHMVMSGGYDSTTDLERALQNCVELYFEERERASALRYSEHVHRAQQYIRKEYSRDISVADIADSAGISEGHLRRLFKQEMNMSVVDYLTEYRIQQAKYLLRENVRPASDIWKETGFSSAQYFSYVFKKKEGISPREYQRQTETV